MKYADTLLHPRLADEEGLGVRRAFYTPLGYILTIPRPDASEEEFLSFARALANPWDEAASKEWIRVESKSAVDVSSASEGNVIYVPVRASDDFDNWPWKDWARPDDLLNALRDRERRGREERRRKREATA